MYKTSAQYHVGIDLGTTHTVVAYANINTPHDIQLLPIEQLIAPGQVAAKPLLPSVRYHPADNELSEADRIFAQAQSRAVLGEAARLLGAKTKGRLVTSAKSWLSHPSVDHNADILPWGSPDEVEKVSPIDASASYLRHIRTIWINHHPDAPLENQDIVLTVPASFDESARNLTLEAAKRAGLNTVRLLEEPQAVCYDWLRRHADSVNTALANVKLLLICDVGGGTTDLTLIKIEPTASEPKLTRIAVGDHILLGGDNIDLTLAHRVESQLQTDQSRLSAADFSQLVEQCRMAKELLLADPAPERANITLLGGGSRLIGGARTVNLTQADIRQVALDGFFPLTALDELPDKKRSGMVEFGLPYTAEPAISKHIAAFLNQHKDASLQATQGESIVPDAILLNGGLFNSQTITQQLLALLKSWRTQPIVQLENNHPELAVAYGAVSYAIARSSKKLKIGGGSARSYFLLVDTGEPSQKSAKQQQALSNPRRGICVLPKGSEEGEETILTDHRFTLRTGVPVRFDLVSNSSDIAAKAGDMTDITDDFKFLPPLVITLDDTATAVNQDQIVQLGVSYTDLGILTIQCIAIADGETASNLQQRWRMEFQTRKPSASTHSLTDNLPQQFNAACEQIHRVFGPKSKQVDANAVKSLRATLEKQLGDKNEWHSSLLRALFTTLWDGQKYYRRSEQHERVWFSLMGFCLRPGFGCPLDDWRVEQLWRLYSQGLQFTNEIQNWSEWWTLWRRIAGGLDSNAQLKIYADIANYINPASSRLPNIAKQVKQRSYDDMIRLAAVLERLPITQKIQLGEWLAKRLEKSSEPKQTWWALGRVAARIPFYGSSHTVISPDVASVWLTNTLQHDWIKHPQIAFAATLICRKSGDRVRDIDDALREQILDKMKSSKAPQTWIDMIVDVKKLDDKEENQFFGETLPPGLTLIAGRQ